MTDDCVAPEKWATVTSKEHWEHIQAQEKKTQINSLNQSQSDGATAIAGPPAIVQAQTQALTQQPQEQRSGQQNPGSMIWNMMSQSSQRTQSKDSDTITVNGTAHKCTIDAHHVACKISQHGAELGKKGSLMDGGEHAENAQAGVAGVADMEMSRLPVVPRHQCSGCCA